MPTSVCNVLMTSIEYNKGKHKNGKEITKERKACRNMPSIKS